jgi:hypothetical protein
MEVLVLIGSGLFLAGGIAVLLVVAGRKEKV